MSAMQYELFGRSDAAAPTVVLSAGLGGGAGFWQPQFDALAAHFRVMRYDHRGTGRNAGILPTGYRIADMADEVAGLLDAAGIERAHFMGHALGGLVGLDLALRHPQRLERLVLVNAWDALDSQTARCFEARLHVLDAGGAAAYVKAQPIFLYPAAWLSANAERVDAEVAHGIAHFQGRENLLARIGALRAFDASQRLREIQAPTLVMAARDDVLVPWTRSRRLADGLPQARLHLVPEGGHAFSATEAPAFNAALLDFLQAG